MEQVDPVDDVQGKRNQAPRMQAAQSAWDELVNWRALEWMVTVHAATWVHHAGFPALADDLRSVSLDKGTVDPVHRPLRLAQAILQRKWREAWHQVAPAARPVVWALANEAEAQSARHVAGRMRWDPEVATAVANARATALDAARTVASRAVWLDARHGTHESVRTALEPVTAKVAQSAREFVHPRERKGQRERPPGRAR